MVCLPAESPAHVPQAWPVLLLWQLLLSHLHIHQGWVASVLAGTARAQQPEPEPGPELAAAVREQRLCL